MNLDPVAIIASFIQLYSLLVLIRVLLTWLPSIDFSSQPFRTLSDLTDPYLNLFRGLIPAFGGMDFSPMVALLALNFLGQFLTRTLATAFYQYQSYMIG